MIIGIGVDIVEISRIEQATKNQRFMARVFTPAEITYCHSRKSHATSSFAGRFAGKEAVMKALQFGGFGKSWQEIEILPTESGSPKVILYGKCKIQAELLGVNQIHISISHHETSAIAQVVLC